MTARSLPALVQRHGARYRWILLLSLMVGTMASTMSSTIVNVAIPDLSHHFSLGQERVQWVSSGFMVAMTVSMLSTPWLLTRYGYQRVYMGCMLLLMAGGVVGGLAGNFSVVLAARLAEGLAAGVVQPIPAIIILRAFEPDQQGRASGVFGMGVVLAPAIGPTIGGLLVDLFGWRSTFFMLVPLCMLALCMAWKFVPDSAPGGAVAARGSSLDWRGLVLGAAGTICLLNGLTEVRNSPVVAAGLLCGAALLFMAFVLFQQRLALAGAAPLVNLALFRFRSFTMGSVVSFIYGMALFGSTYLLPVYIQLGLGLSASYVGTILLPAGLVLAATIAGVGRLADRQPTWLLVSIGLALLASSFALMSTIETTSPLWLVISWAILGRIGLGFILPSLNLGAMRSLERELIPQGASSIDFLRTLGGAAGVSLCAIVLEWRLAARGLMLGSEGQGPNQLAALNESFLMLAVICAVALSAALQLRQRTPLVPR